MGATFDVTAILKANVSDFSRGLKEAQMSLESLRNQTGSSLDKVSQSLSTVGSSMFAVGAGMTAGFTVPVVGAIGGVVKAYAGLEQALGGVETMFKDSASTVVANSETAYKRAGVSGVKYMEQVTSFSASLLQGLGGDTVEAARYADMAIVDMSDNANKFGSNIQDIQNAYQGFAKDNYTMLDNLKLGYGGTQSEMARLVNESGVLNGEFEATAENVKDIPFDKLIEAIHVTQERLGITGTTAKEASETVSGSFDSMKAAAQNLVAGLGQKDADIKGLLSNLGETIQNFVRNVKNVVLTIWDNLPLAPWQKWLGLIAVAAGPFLMVFGTIVGAIGKVVGVISAVSKAFGLLKAGFIAAQTGGTAVAGVFGTLGGIIGGITAPVWAVIGVIAALVAGFVLLYNTNEEFRTKVQAAWEVIKSAISTAVEAVVSFVMDLWGQMVAWWNENQELIRQTAETVWNAIRTVVETVMTALIPIVQTAWDLILAVVTTVWNVIKTVVDTGLKVVLGIIKAVMQMINGDWSGAWETLKGVAGTIWEGIKSLVQVALDGLGQIIQTGLDFLKSIWDTIWNAISSTLSTIWESIKNTVMSVLQPIAAFISQVLKTIQVVWELTWDSIKTFFAALLLVIVGLVTGNFDMVKEAISKAWGKIKANTEQIWNVLKAFLSNTWENIKSVVSNAVDNVKNFVSDGWNRVVSTVTNAGPRIVSAVRTGFDNAVNAARNFISNAISVGGDLINGFVEGVKGAAGRLIDAVGGAVSGAIDWAKGLLGIKSPSRVFRQFGIYTDEGFVIGINSGAGKVMKSMAGMAQGAISAFTGQDVAGSLQSELGAVDGELGRLTAYDPSVSFKGGTLTVGQQAADIVLKMGNTVYRAFTEDITNAQEMELILDHY
ncbi:phage tail protein [Streptococcus suis]